VALLLGSCQDLLQVSSEVAAKTLQVGTACLLLAWPTVHLLLHAHTTDKLALCTIHMPRQHSAPGDTPCRCVKHAGLCGAVLHVGASNSRHVMTP
jgi:hypothetical protein